ncbi:hypothetical protein D3C72_1754460 [compost metagenome]
MTVGTMISPRSASVPKIRPNMAAIATGRFQPSFSWKWLMPGSMAEAMIKAIRSITRMSGILLASQRASRIPTVTITERAEMLTVRVRFKGHLPGRRIRA